MTLVISQKVSSLIPIEVDMLPWDDLSTMKLSEVSRALVQHGNRQVEFGECFEIKKNESTEWKFLWEGDCSRVKGIGSRMSQGTIQVEGDAGMHLGVQMSGGSITVNGNAADWVGAEMKGGSIHVRGNAGHLVGAAYRGGRRGMTGGEIVVDGNVGNEVGHTMRRGTIVVGGTCGDAVGFNMIAGSILLCGGSGIRPGAGMKRGSIVFLDGNSVALLSTFRHACRYRPSFFGLMISSLSQYGISFPDDVASCFFDRYNGDFLELGQGEILVRVS